MAVRLGVSETFGRRALPSPNRLASSYGPPQAWQRFYDTLRGMSDASVLLRNETSGEQFRPGCERRIIHTSQLMTVVIDIDNGPWETPDPYHSHPHEQITYIAEGELIFLAEGEEPRRLREGDLFAVPSGRPHAVQLLSKRARLVDSFNPIREDFLKA
jgi:quercetin dioxygenase-like cupin family protein